eukprot:scaffold9999_cov146-Isochrysis_galbana.AAC.1
MHDACQALYLYFIIHQHHAHAPDGPFSFSKKQRQRAHSLYFTASTATYSSTKAAPHRRTPLARLARCGLQVLPRDRRHVLARQLTHHAQAPSRTPSHPSLHHTHGSAGGHFPPNKRSCPCRWPDRIRPNGHVPMDTSQWTRPNGHASALVALSIDAAAVHT